MDKFDIIVELMVKNGVTTKFSENLFKNLVDNELIIDLDFSEHDKVFEDKIESLEKKNKDLKSCFTQREQDSTDMIMKLKQEKLDKNEKIAELTCENESLKRRIDELESKETEKPTKYTTVIVAKEINGQEYVRLEDFMSVVNDFQAEIGT